MNILETIKDGFIRVHFQYEGIEKKRRWPAGIKLVQAWSPESQGGSSRKGYSLRRYSYAMLQCDLDVTFDLYSITLDVRIQYLIWAKSLQLCF